MCFTHKRLDVSVPTHPLLRSVFLKTDWIRAFYAGALPSFAECKQLKYFKCSVGNKFTGTQVR